MHNLESHIIYAHDEAKKIRKQLDAITGLDFRLEILTDGERESLRQIVDRLDERINVLMALVREITKSKPATE